MNLGKRSAGAALLAAVLLTAATGCSNKAQDNSSSGSSGGGGGEVQTDIGVEGKTIKLGVLTDLTGVFAALGKDLTNSNTLYWKDHKVCDTYTVDLDVQDTGYVPQTGVQLYSGMKDSILAMQQTIGSPINAALAPSTRPTRSSTSRRRGRRPSPRSPAPGSSAPPTTSRSPTATTTCSRRASSRRATPSGTSTSRVSTARTAWPARRPWPRRRA